MFKKWLEYLFWIQIDNDLIWGMIITNDFSQTIKWKQKWDQVILPENCQPDSNCKEENPPGEEFEFNMWATKLLFMQNFLLCLSQKQLCLNNKFHLRITYGTIVLT